jgi:hypothetical protein
MMRIALPVAWRDECRGGVVDHADPLATGDSMAIQMNVTTDPLEGAPQNKADRSQ